MRRHILTDADELGRAAAELAASTLNDAIAARGSARLVLSTGASQFTTIEALVDQPVDWTKVEMFHLDEYLGIDQDHPASFIRYLRDRFVSRVDLGAAHFVDPTLGPEQAIAELTAAIRSAPIDVGLIGIGENAHLAFNDPPADFGTTEAYIVVNLDDACRRQQVREGWFADVDEVPSQAISMTVHQILACRHIVSAVPYAAKAAAIAALHASTGLDPMVPATALVAHPNVDLLLDQDSAAGLDR